MKLTSLTLAATLLMTTFASAQSAVDSVRSQLSAQGYTVTNVTRNGSQYSVSSQGNGNHREVTFNAATGEVMSDDYGRSSSDDRYADNDNERSHNTDRDHDNERNDDDHGRGYGNDNDHGSNDRDSGHSGNSDSGHGGNSDSDSDHGESDHGDSDDD